MADAVIFGTYLYVGAVAFIREFQGSPFVWWNSKVRFYMNRRKFLVPTIILPKTDNFYWCQVLFQSPIDTTKINQINENYSKMPISPRNGDGGFRRFFHSSILFMPLTLIILNEELLELSYEGCYTKRYKNHRMQPPSLIP